MNEIPRVAMFCDTYHEINGAANVLRRLTAYAKEKSYPFMCVRSGAETGVWREGSLTNVELKRGRLAMRLDAELEYDPMVWKYRSAVRAAVNEFKPDVLHVTGLNDVSQIGLTFAHFMKLPAVASWHTNTHEYAARRLTRYFNWLPEAAHRKLNRGIERFVWRGLMTLNFMAQIQLAPNEELVRDIQKATRRPSFLMSRGVDTEFLNPAKRDRDDEIFTLGFVGRLRPEKNVRFFADLNRALQKAGIENYKFSIVGEGSDEEWIRRNVPRAELNGFLRGEALARAYANFDLFVFPSKTDAFGNVVLEAMAAGVPGVVMKAGGPKFLIEDKVNGFVADTDAEFIETIVELAKNPARVRAMRRAARAAAIEKSWDKVFERVYEIYRTAKTIKKNVRADDFFAAQT